MEKVWKKSKITVNVQGFDGEKRVRNLSNAIENVTSDQMTELLDLLEHLTGDSVLETKVVREDKFMA